MTRFCAMWQLDPLMAGTANIRVAIVATPGTITSAPNSCTRSPNERLMAQQPIGVSP